MNSGSRQAAEVAPCIPVLAGDEPLAERLDGPDGARRGVRSLEAALLAALLGRRDEAERTLLCIPGESPAAPGQALSTAWAFVLIEMGEPARAAAHAQSAVERPEGRDPTDVAVARLLLAQAIAGHGRFDPARELARRVLESLSPDPARAALRSYASLVVASLALDVGDVRAAVRAVEIAAGAQPSGLLGARTDVLRARVTVAGAGDPDEAAKHLERGIERLGALGARRCLGLALLFRATAQLDGRPGAAMASAHRELTVTGGAADLALVRAAAQHAARTLPEPVAPCDAMKVRLRHHRLRVHATVSRICEAHDVTRCGTTQPCARLEMVDDMAALVAHSEQQPAIPLARCLIDRARVGQLVAAAQALAAITDPKEVAAAIPRIALTVCSGVSAQMLRASRTGSVETLASYGPPPQVAAAEVEHAVGAALGLAGRNEAAEREGRSFAAVPIREAGQGLALFVAAASPVSVLTRADVERLIVFASLAGSTLARTRAAAELRESAARDAATLGAIADGLLAIGEDGIVRSANQAAAKALGVRRDDLVGRRLRQLPGLAPLSLALERVQTQLVDVVELPNGEFVVHAHTYDGGIIATIREASMERQIARRLIGASPRFTFDDLIGRDPAFVAVVNDARRAASTALPILIGGESGTGKELLAQAIHNASPQASSPFVAINVTAIPHELLESELFGYEGGAFTGARTSGQAGKFELAGRGTVVLDEIGEMPLEMQSKLLRVLQERVVQRLGGPKEIPVRARVTATTHRDLESLVREGRFRLDLFHRLRVVHLCLPPLRARPGDVRLIAEDHLAKHGARTGVHVRIAPAVLEALEAHHWPGNVRELVNVLDCELGLLPPGTREMTQVPRAIAGQPSPRRYEGGGPVLPLQELERRGCEAALRHFDGNVSRAAKALGVSRATLYAKMKRYDLEAPEVHPRPAAEANGGPDKPWPAGSTDSARR